MAHFQELIVQDLKITRPRQLYVGAEARDYVPMAQRT
jgi:citrate synthase